MIKKTSRKTDPKGVKVQLDAQKELDKLLKEFELREQKILNDLTKEQRKAIGHPIKSIRHLDTFKANGKKYIIRPSLTIARFEEFEKIEVNVTFGTSFQTLFGNLRKAWDYLNSNEPANASVTLYNTMIGIKDKLEERENPMLMLCALFICTEEEDVSKYDPAICRAKIADWRDEGIAMKDFFGLAFNLVNDFMPTYEKVSKGILSRQKKTQK